ncbi:MAG: tetratricopeptide repeat protein, partial [Armatimonadetes bacterium]|nr:tetratricopeptide repeat protein [Armatimonadota bacterium]
MRNTNRINEPGKGRSKSARLSSIMKRADSLAEQGQYDEAIERVKEAMALFPRDPNCSIRLASFYQAQNQMGLAIEAMHRVVELDPRNIGIQQLLLRTLIEMGRYEEAVDTSNRLLEKSPKNILARDILGIAYLQQGRLDKALKVTEELIHIAPTDSAHHFKKAVLLQQKGEIAAAMAVFLRTLEMDPLGEMADDTLEAIASLDNYQLRQILTVAVEDAVFKAKLALDPDKALNERGFKLSPSGI